MTNLLSEAAAEMAKAGHKKRTPEQRTEKAAKAAEARWKGNGLTRDQERVLRKLVKAETSAINTPKGKGGERVKRAVAGLLAKGIVSVDAFGNGSILYRRGTKWRPGLLK